MALVKKYHIRGQADLPKSSIAGQTPAERTAPPRDRLARDIGQKRRRSAQGGSAAERIGAASIELASGIAEAASAAGELQRAMAQISTGADEAAGAAQESLGLIKVMAENFDTARGRAEASSRQADQLGAGFAETDTLIKSSVAAIELNADRQLGLISIIEVLERRANAIADLSRVVSDISDQTGLLALNAALGAARADDNGRGFSIVADEVRALAEASEADARQVEVLSTEITFHVKTIADRIRTASEIAKTKGAAGRVVAGKFDAARSELAELSKDAQTILNAAMQADAAAREAQRGAEQVASAAEEQSAAASEAQQAIGQQNVSLEQSHKTTEDLSAVAERLVGEAAGSVVVQVAASAEELSATVQELSGAANQILIAVDQINRGAEMQASAASQADVAMGQIETGAMLAKERASVALDRVQALQALVVDGKETIERLARGVTSALQETRGVLTLILGLGDTTRRIEKIIDGLALVAVQINMLAVIGSIESTRAGDAGTGFATVSSDIRKLSRTTAESAQQAKETVRAMQDQLSDLRRDLDQIAIGADFEVSRNLSLATRLTTMVADLASTESASRGIQSSTDDILASVSEIRRGTASIASSAEEASAASRQAAAAAQQQAQGAEELAAAIEEIASISNVLAAGKA